MILLKYAKSGLAVYLAHLNVLRHLERTLRRAQIPVGMSAGYHPHMNIFMANPLGLGLASECEYVVLDCGMEAEEVLRRYNAHCIRGLEASNCRTVSKNPNVAALGIAARYEAHIDGLSERKQEVAAFFAQKPLVLRYEKNGKPVEMDITDRMYGYAIVGDRLSVTLGCAQKNVRPDKLASALQAAMGLAKAPDFVKKEMYAAGDGCLERLDDRIAEEFCEVSHA